MTPFSTTDPMALGWLSGWERPYLGTYSEWCAKHVVLAGSALTDLGLFNPLDTPWVIDVLNDCDPRRMVFYNTFVKPVQAGGSVVGEAAILCWLYFLKRGDIQYNWESDEKARERWKKRFEKILRATRIILEILPNDPTKYQTCLIILDRLNFTMQGVESDANLASDSIRAQVNEELHNWEAGKMALAYGRTTAYQSSWFHILNISNASNVGDQLHKALQNGTNREWMVECPGCGLFHALRCQWDDNEPQGGGLRYDSTGCKRDDGSYDYNKLAPTVRYQMPCGFVVADDKRERKALSDSGKYSEPRNTGAHKSEESRTLEAVSVHYISWLTLIREKHDALKSLRYGDPEPWIRYLKERECRFWDPEEAPLTQSVVIRSDVKKNRAGLAGRTHRFFSIDRQKGSLGKGEFPHFWLLIVDVGMAEGKLTLQIVFEGKILTEEDVIARLDEHDIKADLNRHFGMADCTWDTQNMMRFCLQYGINAIVARGDRNFAHENGVRRVFSVEKPLYLDMGANPKYKPRPKAIAGKMEQIPDRREPMRWYYSESGVKDILHFLQHAPDVQIIIPNDVSKDFRAHMESWMRFPKKQTDGSVEMEWQQKRTRDDLYICLTTIAMLMQMSGLIGSAISKPEEKK